jgi:hypothetical protein
MKSELDIWRSARLLVEQHGADAVATAEARAQAHLDKADHDNWVLWMRIAAAILEMQKMPPDRKDHGK